MKKDKQESIEELQNNLPNGVKTRQSLEKKGLYPKILERRLLRLNRNTLIEAPKDLEEKDEADYIRMKKIEFNIK